MNEHTAIKCNITRFKQFNVVAMDHEVLKICEICFLYFEPAELESHIGVCKKIAEKLDELEKKFIMKRQVEKQNKKEVTTPFEFENE